MLLIVANRIRKYRLLKILQDPLAINSLFSFAFACNAEKSSVAPEYHRSRDSWRQYLMLFGLFASFVCHVAHARPVIIGVLIDGPAQRELIPLKSLQQETRALLGKEFEVLFPADKQLNGAWSVNGIEVAAQRLLADPEVDIILANGLVSSHVLATEKFLPKPVIATVVADPVLQKLPREGDSSGQGNLVYLADDHTAVSYTHLTLPTIQHWCRSRWSPYH